MIKLDSLSRWNALPKGGVLTLAGDAQRRIRLNVNSPKRISLFIVNDDGEPIFLAAPVGRDIVEFAAGGDVRITTDDNDVFIYTAENEPTFHIVEDAEIYTQIANRAARNPDLEHMLYLQQINMERRFAALSAEMAEQVNNAYDSGRNMANAQPPATDAREDDAGQSEPSTDGGASAASAEPAEPATA